MERNLIFIFMISFSILLKCENSNGAYVLTSYLTSFPWVSPINVQWDSNLTTKAQYYFQLWFNEITQLVPTLTFNVQSQSTVPSTTALPLMYFRRDNTASLTFCENEAVAIGQNRSNSVTYINVVQNSNIDCATRGWFFHLLLHALGFLHEHQRHDRNNYIYVNSFNFHPYNSSYAQRELLLNTRQDGTILQEYDYASVMHYHHSAFAASGKSTIVPLPPTAVSWLSYGHATNTADNYTTLSVLSLHDIAALQRLFPAPMARPVTFQFCQNGGTFRNWCMCPPGFGGRYCESVSCFRTCQNGGTCTINSNVPVCSCPSPYIGNFCEINSAASSGCTSIGGCPYWSKCVTTTATPTCDCEPFPYQGATCSIPYVYVNTTTSAMTTTTVTTSQSVTQTLSPTATFTVTATVQATTTPVACTFGLVVPTAKPRPFSASAMYLRMALTDIYYLPDFSNLTSYNSTALQSFLWQVLNVDYTTQSNGKFVGINLVTIQPPYWGESTYFWNPSQIIAAFGCVIVDFVAVFSLPLTPKERQFVLSATANYAKSDTPVFFGRYGDIPLKATRVSGFGYITPQNLVLTDATPCTVYAAESACKNGGQCSSYDGITPSCLCMPDYTGEWCEYMMSHTVGRDWPVWLIVFVGIGSAIILLVLLLIFVYCRNRCVRPHSNAMWFPPTSSQMYGPQLQRRRPFRLPRFVAQPDRPVPSFPQAPFVRPSQQTINHQAQPLYQMKFF